MEPEQMPGEATSPVASDQGPGAASITKELVGVRFLKDTSLYSAGEVAGFDPVVAQRMVDQNVAAFVDGASRSWSEKALTALRFLKDASPFVAGEVAGFNPVVAQKMVDRGIGTPVDSSSPSASDPVHDALNAGKPVKNRLLGVRFLKALPPHAAGMESFSAYSVGEVAGFEPVIAQRLVDSGFAAFVDPSSNDRDTWSIPHPDCAPIRPDGSTGSSLRRSALAFLGKLLGNSPDAGSEDSIETLEASIEKIDAERANAETSLAQHADARRDMLFSEATDDAILKHDIAADRTRIKIERLAEARRDLCSRLEVALFERDDLNWRRYFDEWSSRAKDYAAALDAAYGSQQRFADFHSQARGEWARKVDLVFESGILRAVPGAPFRGVVDQFVADEEKRRARMDKWRGEGLKK